MSLRIHSRTDNCCPYTIRTCAGDSAACASVRSEGGNQTKNIEHKPDNTNIKDNENIVHGQDAGETPRRCASLQMFTLDDCVDMCLCCFVVD